jgi:hypothetical protein
MEIDLEEFLSENADRSDPHKYLLYGFVYKFILITALFNLFLKCSNLKFLFIIQCNRS